MASPVITKLGQGQNKTASSAVSVPCSGGAVAVNDIVLVAVALDPGTGGITGSQVSVTGATIGSWFIPVAAANGSGTSGVRIQIMWAFVTGAGTITNVSIGNAVTAKAAEVFKVVGADATNPVVANGVATAPPLLGFGSGPTDGVNYTLFAFEGLEATSGTAVNASPTGKWGAGGTSFTFVGSDTTFFGTTGAGSTSNISCANAVNTMQYAAGQPITAQSPALTSSGTRECGAVVFIESQGPAAQTFTPTGISSDEAFGTATENSSLTSSPTAIGTAEAFGTDAVSYSTTYTATGISTAEAFGTATENSTLTSSPTAVATAEAFGTANANVVNTATATGIATQEAFGTPTKKFVNTYTAVGIGDSLATFRTALTNRETSRVNIGLLGCSLIEGYPCTADKTVAQFLAQKLRTMYPTSGSPTGYGRLSVPSPSMAGITAVTITAGTGGVVGTSDGTTGWGANHQTWYSSGSPAVPPIIVFPIVNGPWSSADIDILGAVGYSAVAGKYRVDGGSWVNFSLSAPGPNTAVNKKINIPGTINSTIEVSIETGNAGSNIIVNGVTGYKGDESKGIICHNFGHSGFKVSQWRASAQPNWDFRYDQAMENLNLLIISDLGINDAQAISSATYRTNLIDFMNYLKTVHTTVPIVFVNAYDMTAGVTFLEPWANYTAVNREVAGQFGCLYIDLTQLMPATPNAIYYTDNAHSNTNGDAYALMADILSKAITSEMGLPTENASLTSSFTGISTQETFGTAAAQNVLSATFTGISSTEAFGATQMTSLLSATATGIATSEAFGAVVSTTSLTSVAVAIASGEVFGTPSANFAYNATAVGIASAEAFGTTQANSLLTASFTGLTSQEAFGTALANAIRTATAVGIASVETFGAVVAALTLSASPTGIVTLEAFGVPTAQKTLTASFTGINSAEAFGAFIAVIKINAAPTGISTQEAFGVPILSTGYTAQPTGIGSTEAFGIPAITTLLVSSPTGIGSAEGFGVAVVSYVNNYSLTSIASAEAFGVPVVTNTFMASPIGIASLEAFGAPTELASLTSSPVGIPSAESFGSAQTNSLLTVSPAAIPSGEVVSVVTALSSVTAQPIGIPPQEAFGTLIAQLGAVSFYPLGIPSEEAFGLVVVSSAALPSSEDGRTDAVGAWNGFTSARGDTRTKATGEYIVAVIDFKGTRTGVGDV